MKKLLNRFKALVAIISVLAILAVSVFSAISGVTFKAKAESVASEYTKDERELSLLDSTQPNSKSNPYIIANANQMYSLMCGNATYNNERIDTAGKYFKVADGIDAFYMNGGDTVAGMTTVAQVKEYFEVTNTSAQKVWTNSSYPFKGNFDGNGVTVYGIYSDAGSGGLFPYVAGSVTIKNVAVKNSYFKASCAGGIVGSALVPEAVNTLAIDNCEVANNYISAGRSDAGAGALFGFLYNQVIAGYPITTATNCIVYGNELESYHANNPGSYAIAGSLNNAGHKFTNCILLDAFPFNSGAWHMKQAERYDNVFTDADLSGVGAFAAGTIATVTKDMLKGKTGLNTLKAFDFSSVWFASEDMPKLRVFHKISGTPVNVDGHNNEIDVCCSQNSVYDGLSPHVYLDDACEICGYKYPCVAGHVFTDVPAVETSTEAPGNIAYKSCSGCQKNYATDAAIDAPLSAALTAEEIIIPQILPYDEWDGNYDDYYWMNNIGDGSPANPFIIETAEQLVSTVTARLKYDANKSVADGFDISKYTLSGNTLDTSGLFFKVKDGITGFRMNGGQAVVDMTSAAEVKAFFETNPGKMWWVGTSFKGNFNGNGATVYGLYATKEATGLFPYLGADAVIKNIHIKNSYMKSTGYVGGLFGQVRWYEGISDRATTTVRNCSVVNCYIRGENTGGDSADAGIIASHGREQKLKVKNFLAYGNDISSVSGNLPGLFGKSWCTKNEMHDIVLFDVVPFSIAGGRELNYYVDYQNVYTNQDIEIGEKTSAEFLSQPDFKYEETQIKTLTTEQMWGIAAKENMSALDWNELWQVNEDSYPTPKVLILTEYQVGYPWSGDVAKEFPAGEGTKENPYKISAPEHLALMLKSDNDGIFYQLIADVMINDTTVENWKDTAKQWYTSADVDAFSGTLDGNGYTVSGLYYKDIPVNQSAGLIPVKSSGSVNNLTVADSYISVSSGSYAAAIVGSIVDGAPKPITMLGNTVKNSVVIEGVGVGAGLVGRCGNSVLRINNCITSADVKTEAIASGIVAITGGGISVKNSISTKIEPFGNADAVVAINVYTDATRFIAVDGVTYLTTDALTGDNVKSNTKLDFNEVWTTVANDYPAISGAINTLNGTIGDIWSGEVAKDFAGGSGTAEDPYLVATGEQLAKVIVNHAHTKHYKLVADIYLNDVNSSLWKEKIGCNEWYTSKEYNGRVAAAWAMFTGGGSFDGDGYVIYGLYYNRSNVPGEDAAFCGLFPTIGGNGAVIKNIGISDAYLLGTNEIDGVTTEFIGAITGFVNSWSDIDLSEHNRNASYIKQVTSTPEYQAKMPKIQNCFVDHKSYIAGRNASGFVGGSSGTVKLENCIFTGTLGANAAGNVAGLIGQDMSYGSHFVNCISFPQTCDKPLGGTANANWRTAAGDLTTTAINTYYFSMYRQANTVTKIAKPIQRVGEEAMLAMPGLDWVGNTEDGTEDIWRVVENGTPMLTVFDKHRDDADIFSDKAFAAPFVKVSLITGTSEVVYEDLEGRMYSKMELPTPVRPGYKFTGWYPHSNLSVEYPYDYFPPRSLNLYAGWEPNGVICNFENYADSIWDYDDTRWIYNKPGAKGGYKNEYVRNGSKSMHLLDNSSEPANVMLNYEDMLDIGKTYTMTFWVTTDRADNPDTTLSLIHNAKPFFLNTGVAKEEMVVVKGLTVGEWTQYTYSFKAQTEWVSIEATGNSSLYFDDIIISESDSAVNNGNIIYLDTSGNASNTDKNQFAPNTTDNMVSVAVLVCAIMSCAVIAVISRKNLVEIVE
ncbi:MAG: hypothetical protein E7521_05550 [Ruminococcaceae bacterium]|nr:hypothetical protein [Oscillospiraceae bacterium]